MIYYKNVHAFSIKKGTVRPGTNLTRRGFKRNHLMSPIPEGFKPQ